MLTKPYFYIFDDPFLVLNFKYKDYKIFPILIFKSYVHLTEIL